MAKTVLGVDYGTKRVGVALAEAGQAPRRLVTMANDADLATALGELLAAHKAQVVVVGLPRNLDGDETPQTALTRQFAAELRHRHPAVTVVLQDEAMTSELARQRLEAEGVVAKNIAGLLDQEAAAIITEDYLRDH